MKKIIWLIAVISIQGMYAQTLTLKMAINKTLAHHPDVQTFILRIQQAEQGHNIAYADYLPQVDLSILYNPKKTYVLPVNGRFHTLEDNGWNAGVTLHQKVWDFSKTASLIGASKVDENIAKFSLKEVKSLLAYKVKSLYSLLVVQREAIVVRDKDLQVKKAFYAQSKALVMQGLKTHADSNRFLSSVYVAEESLAIAKASFEKTKVSLSLYTGIKIDSHVKLQNYVLKKKYKWHKSMENEILEDNYKLKMDRLNIYKNHLLHQSAKSARFGSIDFVASYDHFDTLNKYNADYVGVSYNIPLYTGGKLSALEQKAQLSTMIAKEQEASDKLSLKEEYSALVIDIKRYTQTIKTKKAQLASAKSTEKELKARYKEGISTYIEVLDSTSLVLNAKLGVLEAYYARSLALDRLVYLKGKI